ncbi:MAG: hypothetical protein R3F43_04905 [bacterium]
MGGRAGEAARAGAMQARRLRRLWGSAGAGGPSVTIFELVPGSSALDAGDPLEALRLLPGAGASPTLSRPTRAARMPSRGFGRGAGQPCVLCGGDQR